MNLIGEKITNESNSLRRPELEESKVYWEGLTLVEKDNTSIKIKI